MSRPAAEPSTGTLLAYALPALPLAVLALPFYVLVPAFYSEGLGLPLAAVGHALLLVRILDAASDPVTGILADRFRPGFGRRRLWLLLSAPMTAAAAFMVFRPPEGATTMHLLLWGGLLSIAWTATQIAHGAWGAELSRSYAGRTRVAAYREGLTVAGTFIALATPALLPQFGLPGQRDVLNAFAVTVGIGLPLAALITVLAVPEPVERRRARKPFMEGLREVFANAPFRRLLGAFFINGLANGLPGALFVFFVSRRLEAPDAVGPLLVLYFACAVLGVPIWLKLAARTSKHRAWALGMGLAIAAFVFAPFLGPGDVAVFAVITAVTGFALGADVVLPASIQADVIDVDTARSGEERAGFYISFWTLATKLALAGGVGIAFPLLAASGFDPAQGIVTERGLTVLAFLYAGLPSLLKIAAVALVFRFPLDRAAADALARVLADQAERGGSDPDPAEASAAPVDRPTSAR